MASATATATTSAGPAAATARPSATPNASADELEAKVFDALVAVYNHGDLVREAVEAHRSGNNGEADRVRAALAAVESGGRKTEAAIERYMLAFEAGEVSQAASAGGSASWRRRRPRWPGAEPG